MKNEFLKDIEDRAKPLIDLLNEQYDYHTRVVVGMDFIKVIRDEVSVPLKVD